MEKPVVNNHYLALINRKSLIENCQRLINVFTINKYFNKYIKD